MRCRKKPPHVSAGKIVNHSSKRECDEWEQTHSGPPSPAPGPAPGSPGISPTPGTEATTPASRSPESKPAPSPRPRLIKVIPRSPNATGEAPLRERVAVAEEWELTDELCGRFWDGVAGLLRMVVRLTAAYFEIERPISEKVQGQMEFNDSDKRQLAACTKDALTAGFKRLGVKSLEAAERIINNFGGWQVLLVLLFTFALFFWQEVPRSPKWLRWKEQAKEAEAEAVARGEKPAPRSRWFGGGARYATSGPRWGDAKPKPDGAPAPA